MSIGLFTDKHHEPTDEEIIAALGSKLPLWQELIQYLREIYRPQEDFRFFYGKDYGWARRFRIKGRLLTTLYPRRDGYTAQVILNPAAVEMAQQMNLGQNTQAAIGRAKPYPEGRWLFVLVESESDVGDLQQLIGLRVNPKRH